MLINFNYPKVKVLQSTQHLEEPGETDCRVARQHDTRTMDMIALYCFCWLPRRHVVSGWNHRRAGIVRQEPLPLSPQSTFPQIPSPTGASLSPKFSNIKQRPKTDANGQLPLANKDGNFSVTLTLRAHKNIINNNLT